MYRFQTADLGLILLEHTHHITNSSKRKLLHEPGKKVVQQPVMSESPLHDYLSFKTLFTGMFPNIWKWQKGAGGSLPAPITII